MPTVKKKKSKGGSKKGFPFEREMSKVLSLWWTHGVEDNAFWRTQQSGGRATIRARKGKKSKYQYGDLTFDDPIGTPFIDFFLIECKRGYTDKVDVLDCLDVQEGRKTKPEIIEWWDKSQIEKEQGERREVFIIIRRNNRKAVLVLCSKFVCRLEQFTGEIFDRFIDIDNDKTIILLDDFLKKVTPETIILMGERE